jgi:hypothetical protein
MQKTGRPGFFHQPHISDTTPANLKELAEYNTFNARHPRQREHGLCLRMRPEAHLSVQLRAIGRGEINFGPESCLTGYARAHHGRAHRKMRKRRTDGTDGLWKWAAFPNGSDKIVPFIMACDEKVRLVEAHHMAALAYARAVKALNGSSKTGSAEERNRLKDVADDAKASSKEARRLVQQHTAEHGC